MAHHFPFAEQKWFLRRTVWRQWVSIFERLWFPSYSFSNKRRWKRKFRTFIRWLRNIKGFRGVACLVAGATGISDRGSLLTATVEGMELSEEETSFSGVLEFCTVYPVYMNFEFISETGGAEGKLLLSHESVEKSRTTSLSRKKLLVTRIVRSIQYTVSSEVIESKISILNYIQLISVLLYYSGNCFEVVRLIFR